MKNDHLTIRASNSVLDFPFEDLFSNEEETFFDYIGVSHVVGLSYTSIASILVTILDVRPYFRCDDH